MLALFPYIDVNDFIRSGVIFEIESSNHDRIVAELSIEVINGDISGSR